MNKNKLRMRYSWERGAWVAPPADVSAQVYAVNSEYPFAYVDDKFNMPIWVCSVYHIPTNICIQSLPNTNEHDALEDALEKLTDKLKEITYVNPYHS